MPLKLSMNALSVGLRDRFRQRIIASLIIDLGETLRTEMVPMHPTKELNP